MNYFTLLFKKISYKRLNIIPILFISLFIVVVYMGHQNIIKHEFGNSKYPGFDEIEILKEDISFFEKEIERYEPNSKAYENTKYNLNMAKQRMQLLQSRLDAYKEGNWKDYYKNDSKLISIDIEALQSDRNYNDKEFINTLMMHQEYADYMAKYNLSYDQSFIPIQGISYMARVMNDYLPILATFIIVFIASLMYCSSYVNEMDIHTLIPIHRIERQKTKLLVGVFCGFLLYVFLIVLSIMCGTIGSTFGSLQTPILTYTLEKAKEFVPLIHILPQVLLLTCLSIFFIVNFVSLISLLTKKRMPCLIVSLVIVLGFLVMTTSIIPLAPYVHLLPTTYISALKVISGEMMQVTNNGNINFMNGVIVLVLSNVVLFGLHYYGEKLHLRNRWMKHG